VVESLQFQYLVSSVFREGDDAYTSRSCPGPLKSQRLCRITGYWDHSHSALARRKRGTCRSLITPSETWITRHCTTNGLTNYGLGRRCVPSTAAAMESHIDCGIDCHLISWSVYLDTTYVSCKNVITISQCFAVGTVWQFCVWRLLSLVSSHGGHACMRV